MWQTPKKILPLLPVLFVAVCLVVVVAQTIPSDAAIDAEVSKIMTHTHAKGMAVAVIDHGKVRYVQAYGVRNAKGDPLTTDTVMYGASVTKAVFAYTGMQLVDQGKLKLDTPLKDDLDKPLPSYGPIQIVVPGGSRSLRVVLRRLQNAQTSGPGSRKARSPKAATKLWYCSGDTTLSMRALAKEARTNTPAIYRRFKDRRGVLHALFLHLQQQGYQVLRSSRPWREACERCCGADFRVIGVT